MSTIAKSSSSAGKHDMKSKDSPKRKKSPPKTAVTRNFGGLLGARVMAETASKEQRARESFEANALVLRKARNPCNGEDTAREEAPFLIPVEKIVSDSLKTQQYMQFQAQRTQDRQVFMESGLMLTAPIKKRHIDALKAVHDQRLSLESERDMLAKVYEYKQRQLAKSTVVVSSSPMLR